MIAWQEKRHEAEGKVCCNFSDMRQRNKQTIEKEKRALRKVFQKRTIGLRPQTEQRGRDGSILPGQ